MVIHQRRCRVWPTLNHHSLVDMLCGGWWSRISISQIGDFEFFQILILRQYIFRNFLQDLDGIKELLLRDQQGAVDVIQVIEGVFIKGNIAGSNYLLFTRDPYAIDVPRVVSYQIPNMSARLQLLKLWNVIFDWIGSTAIDMHVRECWFNTVQSFKRCNASSK